MYEGEATAVVGDDEFDLVAGQATWVPAGVPHCFRNRGEGTMTIYWVYGGRDVTRTVTATGETFEHLSESDRGASAGMSAVVTLNPATGERLAEYPAFSDAEVDAALDRAGAAQARLGGAAVRRSRRRAAPGGRGAARRGRGARPAGHPRDGQAAGRGAGRGREVRDRVRLLRRARGGLPRRRAGGDLGRPQLDRLRAGRRRARRHAVELPALAGAPVRRARRSWRATPRCSSTRRTPPAARSRCSGCSPRPARRRACSPRSWSPSPTSPPSPGG